MVIQLEWLSTGLAWVLLVLSADTWYTSGNIAQHQWPHSPSKPPNVIFVVSLLFLDDLQLEDHEHKTMLDDGDLGAKLALSLYQLLDPDDRIYKQLHQLLTAVTIFVYSGA